MNTAPQLSSLGKYHLIANLGHGGMAHIYLALMAGPAGFHKLLVIKALREDIASTGDEWVTMFLDEARLTARLNHPNIVQTYEVGEADGRFFLAMEYLDGQSLRTVERRLKPRGLPGPMQLRIVSEVAKGLHHAHELRGFEGEPLGVVHRDVSPHNVFLTYDGQVKLLDFGIAKAANAVHMTKVGVIRGKADYIAPEQIRGESVDRRADIFSLGVMLWEALSGSSFAGGPDVSEITKMHNRLTGGEPKLRDQNPKISERLAQICEKAIALRPEDRHATALELAQEIDDYLTESYVHPTAQQLSQLISPPFARERDRLRQLIDAQMRQALDPGASFAATTGELLMLPRSQFASGGWTAPKGPGHTPTDARGGVGTSSKVVASPSLPAGAPSVLEPSRRRTVPWPAVVGAVAVSVALATYLAVRPGSGQTSAAPVAVPSPAPSPKAPQVEPAAITGAGGVREVSARTVRVHIEVEPAYAVATLDGARLASLPFDAELPQGREVHTLEVSAPGFGTDRTMLTYERDVALRVVLHREPPKRREGRLEKPAQGPSAPEKAADAPAAAVPPFSEPQAEVEPGMDSRRIPPARPDAHRDAELEKAPRR